MKDVYHLDRFSKKDLIKLQSSIFEYAKSIDGLPKNHSEVFNKRGWMLPFLFTYDDLLWGRWSYWLNIIEKGTIEGSGPIPQIKWSDNTDCAKKMLKKCLNHYESTIDKFALWLHWALAIDESITIDHISPELNRHYYENFDLFLVLDNPTDYLSELLSEQSSKSYKDELSYFPTPFHVSLLIADLSFNKDKDYKKETVFDPCVGCGSTLLPASNYTLRGFGQDVSKIAVDLCKIQMYWYAPWYAFYPKDIKGFNEISIQNTKAGEQLYFTLEVI